MANQYYGSIPQIAQAYQNDPRTRLAASMLATGTQTTPVAQGGWAVTDGLARAAQAIAGAFVDRRQNKKYAERERQYGTDLANAAALASQQQTQPAIANPATVNPAASSMQAAAQALSPPVPAQARTLGNPAMGMAQTTPQSAPMAGDVPRAIPSFDPGPSSAPQAPALASLAPQAAPPVAGAPPRNQMSARDYYFGGIVPIEGGTDRNGNFRTSPKGAIGPGQIMPGTAPEAARLAGLPYDEQRLRTDPEYNNALGQAYYSAQLETFGDPLKAAAAYNAGPGRVRRALRLAQRNGTDWVQYLPAETRDYVTKFTQSVGSGSSGGTPVDAVGAVNVPQPQMEQLPNAPSVPDNAQRPNAPQLPDEVRSNRISMAQQMLQSANPDLVAIAQEYLDKGLAEQNDARTLRSQQQFQQSQTGYSSDLNDFNEARSQGRQFGYNQVQRAEDRNFGREQTYTDQSFRAGESAADREQRTRELNQQQWWQSQENELERSSREREGALDRAGPTGGGRNPFLETASGLKIQKDLETEASGNAGVIASVQRFLELNQRQATGGWVLGSETGRSLTGMTDEEVKEMTGLANEIVVGKLGGLGVAISDGDRKFISDSMVSAGSPFKTNVSRGNMVLGVLNRRNDYIYQWQLAQMQGNPTQFHQEWKAYIDSTPVVRGYSDGTVRYNPVTFEQWKASRPRYNAQGQRVQ